MPQPNIEALSEALDVRDSYTTARGVRVAALADKMTKALGIGAADIETLRL